ncbi:uncharacterized protein LOC117830483 [Notolabrus celidotus]|uniref:uncharacterized protein LOC117830483 n=1 Tax=Notolabrus celidotus TaxID=1203425 RepID=UPI00148FA084|nr:uncharacterized protein LOC117830483 [Notolabrus celidotus]
MASTLVLLLLVSLASASHHMGGRTSYAYKGRNRDGTYKVHFYNRDVYDNCQNTHYWSCLSGDCGTVQQNSYQNKAIIDSSTNAPVYENLCVRGCCWIQTVNNVNNWRLMLNVDLGTRSDTKEPNKSPDFGIVPLLRTPENCPRTYELVHFDPDGDKVRCRYGNIPNLECGTCNKPSGFYLNQYKSPSSYNHTCSTNNNTSLVVVAYNHTCSTNNDTSLVVVAYNHNCSTNNNTSLVVVAYNHNCSTNNNTSLVVVAYSHTCSTNNNTSLVVVAYNHTCSTSSHNCSTNNHTCSTNNNTSLVVVAYNHNSSTNNNTSLVVVAYNHNSSTNNNNTCSTNNNTSLVVVAYNHNSSTNNNTSLVVVAYNHNSSTNNNTCSTNNNTSLVVVAYNHNSSTNNNTSLVVVAYNHTCSTNNNTLLVVVVYNDNCSTTNHTYTTNNHTCSTNNNNTSLVVVYNHNYSTNNNNCSTNNNTSLVVVAYNHTCTTNNNTSLVVVAYNCSTNNHNCTQTTPLSLPTLNRNKRQVRTFHQATATAAAPTTTPNAAKVGAATPLSKQPLQFSFLVDRAVHSCLPGDYLPKYLSPTPDNGVHIHTEVGKEVEIRVKAVSKYSKIDNIIISGPQNTKKHKNTHDEFSITWTPTQDDLGNHYVLCFVVEAKIGSNVYQSDMRCVILDVGNKLVDAHVICTESTMTVEVDRAMCFHISEDHLRLSDPSNVVCNLKTHSNKTHIIAVFPLNACGTQIEEDDEYLKFKNEITTIDNPRDSITRKNLLEIQFFCQYPKRGRVSENFLAHRKSVTVWEKGMGQFEYKFEFYPDTQFRTMIDPNSYPLEYTLGNRIFMQIEAKSSVNNTVLFVESCRATPYDNSNYKPVYSIIEDGCPVDRSVQIHNPSHPWEFRMSFEAFKFIGFHDQVYISCSVLMCKAGDPNTRCAQGCRKVKTFSSGIRNRREIVTQSSAHLISQGPLRLRRSAERADSPVMNLNLNLIFIAGCLLAVVGMISGVNLYKAKITKVKYQPLLTFEG